MADGNKKDYYHSEGIERDLMDSARSAWNASIGALKQFRTKPSKLAPKPETEGSDAAKAFTKGFNKALK